MLFCRQCTSFGGLGTNLFENPNKAMATFLEMLPTNTIVSIISEGLQDTGV